jgi:hypothetical protein
LTPLAVGLAGQGTPEGRRGPLHALAASGQLGYGIPEPAFLAGLARRPDFIGCDMGSVDPGPYYLGSGRMATSAAVTRRDLRLVLTGARRLGVPLLIGSAGTAGAAPPLDATLEMVRDIARECGLHFRLASIRADIQKEIVKRALREGRLRPLGAMPDLAESDIEACPHLVGQMGTEAFVRAVETGADVVVAGRACDTAVFAAIPQRLGYPMAAVMHMAKIIECTSICCTPGGRDAMLATLDGDGFVLESMNPERHATPMSVAAHSLYEQADPFSVSEPEGTLWVDQARYEAVDEHRTRVRGGRFEPAPRPTVKVEGAAVAGERAVLLAASVDPRFIAAAPGILVEVERTARAILPGDYRLYVRTYGVDGVTRWPTAPAGPPREVFILAECIARTAEKATAALGVFKQYLLHHGFPGRISTGGNLAFPFTPPEVATGTAYRFAVYHVMDVEDLAGLFPVEVETV